MTSQTETTRGQWIATIPQADGGSRDVYAQTPHHARRARRLIAADPAMINYLDGVDGIEITVRDRD